jgi:hypothetical protein
MSDVPLPLRRKLQQSTSGINSATILIADKRGREELVRALQGRPTNVECRLAAGVNTRDRDDRPQGRRTMVSSLRTWLELLLPIAIGASLWLFIGSRF